MTRRRTALAALTTCALTAVAGPALAAGSASDVGVSLVASGGTRQFDVLQPGSDVALTALALGSTGTQAFRTRVKDTSFQALGSSYSVSASMSNMYLRRGNGTHEVATKIPSSQLSISQGPLSADQLAASVLPRLSVTGTLAGCTSLPDEVKTSLGLAPGVTDLTTLLVGKLTTPVGLLCTALSTVGAPVSGTVDGLVQQVTTTVSDVTKLPNALTNTAGRSFDRADYSRDAVAATDPDATNAPTATSVDVMRGAAATALPSQLVAALKSAVVSKLGSSDLVSATDTGAVTTVARALDTVTSSTTRGLISALTTAQQAALLNTLPKTVLDPTLATVKDLTSSYYAAPALSADRSAPVAGTYDGTLTLTFVQQ